MMKFLTSVALVVGGWNLLVAPLACTSFVAPSTAHSSNRHHKQPISLGPFRATSLLAWRSRSDGRKSTASTAGSTNSSSNPPSYKERQRIRQEISNLEDEDFLLADLKPKLLVHERDHFRQSTRMAAWDEYVLVSIVCTSICGTPG